MLPCIHRGLPIRTEPCGLCGDREVAIKVFFCAHFQEECALSRTKSGRRGELRQCVECSPEVRGVAEAA